MLTTVQSSLKLCMWEMLSNLLLLTLVCLLASSQSLNTYSLEVLLMYEVKCIDKANVPLFDLQCCKDMLLVPLSWSDGGRLWFCQSCHHCREVWSYVYFHFKPILYIWKELLRSSFLRLSNGCTIKCSKKFLNFNVFLGTFNCASVG
jgi:hypothetical protein